MWGQLIAALLRVSLIGFGGGPSSIPLMHKEVVDKYRWMDNEEFSDILAIGNTLPGPILTKMAGYVGYRLKGVPGCLVAILVTTIPTIVGMILVFALLESLRSTGRVDGMTAAVQPVVGAMMAALAYKMLAGTWNRLGIAGGALLMLASGLLMAAAGIHPAVVIAVLLAVGLLSKHPLQRKRKVSKGTSVS